MQKVVLIGATGFLGKFLLNAIEKQFEDITVVARSPEKVIIPKNIQLIQGDVTEPETLVKALKGANVVFHAAAMVSSWPQNPVFHRQVNVEGVLNVLRATETAGVDKVVYTSSFFAIGETEKEPAGEEWDVSPTFAHPYIMTKYEAEKEVLAFGAAHGLEIVIVNPTAIVGPEMGEMNPIYNALVDYMNRRLPGLPGGGKCLWNFVTPEAVAEGHLLAAERGKPLQRYILGGENLELGEFFGIFGEPFGFKRPRRVPTFLVHQYARAIQTIAKMRKRHPKLTVADFKVTTRNWCYSSELAQKELGYQPSSIIEIVKPTLQWLLDSGRLREKVARKVRPFLNSAL